MMANRMSETLLKIHFQPLKCFLDSFVFDGKDINSRFDVLQLMRVILLKRQGLSVLNES